ncbi:glycoside hydrolase family 38 N-terminal domain-containing protein [Sphingobacterium lumbrici]|uniref:glycoside hydrolase family 38 N-terminal domain-containing protein n=1 Tax=Sphingobacterium lumbrici TaxID=2559600 RepID=UPI00112C0D9B|nr:hypothetical protein [Sphingobacterium lumbrici]
MNLKIADKSSVFLKSGYAAVFLSLLLFGQEVRGQQQPFSPIVVPGHPGNLLPGQTAPGVTDLWVVFKTHCDLGYTMSAKEVLKDYREGMMDNAIRLIEDDRRLSKPSDRFKWSIAGWPMMANILGKEQASARKLKIEQALREGYMNVHAFPATMHTDVFEPEDYVRALGFSSQVARKYGQELPVAAKMTDVPAHSWFLPTLLHHAGIKFLQIGCNYSNRGPILPKLFWWEGPDGSRILCNYTAEYGSGIRPPADWPAKNYLAISMTHDNEGPPSPEQIQKVRNEAAEIKGAQLHIGTLDDFAKALLAENPDLPVIKGDMVDPWIHGVMAMPQETKIARNIRPLIPALDILNTQMNVWKLRTESIAEPLALAYENSMLYGEHTWGAMTPGWGFFSMDGKNRGIERYLYGDDFVQARKEGYYQKFENSFDEHKRYIHITDSIVANELNSRLKTLAQNVKAKEGEIIVYNTLPWSRSGEFQLDGVKIWVNDVPANGYKVLKNEPYKSIPIAHDASLIHTKYFTLRIDTVRGGIASLIEKSTGKELVMQQDGFVLGQFLHERFAYDQTLDYYNRYCTMSNSFNASVKPNMPKDVPYSAVTPRHWKVEVERTAFGDEIVLRSDNTDGIAKSVAIKFTFPNAQAFVDIEWNIVDKVPNTLPEGGWLCFPFNIQHAKVQVGRLGGIMDLEKDQVVGGNRFVYGVHTGAALTDKSGFGMGICAIDAPLMSFGEPGLWKYDYDYLPEKSAVFVNLYNNMWNTNFPYWTEGSWSERVRIWGIAQHEHTAENIAIKSWEARTPLLSIKATGKGKQLSSEKAGISLSRKGVLVTAFGADPDGNAGTLLRVWEQTGTDGEVKIKLPGEMNAKFVTRVNLRGEIIGHREVIKNNEITTNLKAYQPVSFILN